MAAVNGIPVVDFQKVRDAEDVSRCPQVAELHAAFSQVGFVFLTNHGIKTELVEKAFQVGRDFFKLPLPIKKKYKVTGGDDTGYSGYVEMEQESADPEKPGDLKEAYNICDIETRMFPKEELPEFEVAIVELFQSSIACSLKILEAMGHALQLKDPLYFVKGHKCAGHTGSYSTARVLYYPPLPSSTVIKPGQLRCGEHVDYGSITLLFQDPNGGLQVKYGDRYIDVPYMENAVLVNLGALMQRWTSDRYVAALHRVLLPEETARERERQSIAIFMHPDYQELIKCVDGSDKYPPVLAYDDTYQRLNKSYSN